MHSLLPAGGPPPFRATARSRVTAGASATTSPSHRLSEHLIHAFLVRVVALEAFIRLANNGLPLIVLDFHVILSAPDARSARRPAGLSSAVAVAPA